MFKRNHITLPSAFSLVGTKHFPAIDNQGGIGSCASQSVTRNQFTNAVSRYIAGADAEKPFNPQNGDECFAPRFTYNFSGAGTAWVYETLVEHGALSVGACPFEKTEAGASISQKDGVLCEQSAAWPVLAPGQMKQALKYRLKKFDQVWTVKEPYNEQLTTTEAGRALLARIKMALLDGNCVVTGGYPARWIYSEIGNEGTYGKKGDLAVVAAAGTAGGGHQVTLVGYDDDITADFGGVKLKGAFIIANSYGTTWINGGYTFMMYDACNTVSEHPRLNGTELYSGQMYITPGKELKMYPSALTKKNQTLTFEKVSDTVIEGESFGVYTVFDPDLGKYLGYAREEGDRAIKVLDAPGEDAQWCLIPYEKLSLFPGFSKDEYKEEYLGSYWVYALGRETAADGVRFLDAGLGVTASGRATALATLNAGKYPMAKSWTVDAALSDRFESKLGIFAGKDAENHKVWALDQFCFTDWRTDIAVGLPELYIDLEIEAADRESFKVVMLRKDKNGKTAVHVPTMFRYAPYHPTYCKKDAGEYCTFSAKIGGAPEIGYFSFSYASLLNLPKATSAEEYTWGFGIEADKKSGVTLKKATLYYGGKEIPLASINRAKKIGGRTEFYFD